MLNEQNKQDNNVIGDLRMSGSGSAAGGKYNVISISGSGEVNGDVECNEIKTSGSSRINGNVKAISVSTSGSSKIHGNVSAERLHTSGSCKVEGNISIKELNSSGSTKVNGDLTGGIVHVSGGTKIDGNVHVEEIKVSGGIDIGGDCEVERFKASGSFRINGLLSSDNVDISLHGSCKVREIGGEKIAVKNGRESMFGLGKLLELFIPFDKTLEVESIEGDEVFLECTKAKVVRGNNVVIGEGSNIEVVEYTGNLEVRQGAKVKEQKKL
jgi:cytoskeletal protein CcmA (bactofilin family)